MRRAVPAIISAIVLAGTITGVPELGRTQSALEKQAQCELASIRNTRSAVAVQSIRTACNWLALRRTPNAEKKIAVVYWDREMGKGELMRGSATGMFLNAPRSILNVLAAMKSAGYAIDPMPRSEDELLDWMKDHGRQIGVWLPGELDRLARSGSAVLVPVDRYRAWFETAGFEDVELRRVAPDWYTRTDGAFAVAVAGRKPRPGPSPA